MSKKITESQISQIASSHGIEKAVLLAIIEVECKGSGFLLNGTPTILFERHIYWDQLGNVKFNEVRRKIRELRPDLCNPKPTRPGNYGLGLEQPQRLEDAINLMKQVRPDYDEDTYQVVRSCGLKATSWGLGQIMGFNHKSCGFENLQDFINAMYKDEESQLNAVVELLINWQLLDAMRNRDWHKIARTWNGPSYAKFNYHNKLAKYYKRYLVSEQDKQINFSTIDV